MTLALTEKAPETVPKTGTGQLRLTGYYDTEIFWVGIEQELLILLLREYL